MNRKALYVRSGRRVPLGLMPAASENPGARRRLLRGIGHHGDDLIPIARGAQVEIHLGLAHAHEMTMTLDETRYGQLTAEINHFCVWTGDRLHVGIGAVR